MQAQRAKPLFPSTHALAAHVRLVPPPSHIGKWHLGMSSTELLPVNRGFDSSLGYLSGAEDHVRNLACRISECRVAAAFSFALSHPNHPLVCTCLAASGIRP